MTETTTERGEAAVNEMFHFGVPGMKWGVRRAENSQKIANRLQTKATKISDKADRNEGKLGNGVTIRSAKKAQKNADRQQRYATKLQKKVDAKTAAKLDKQTAKDNAAATKAAHEKWKKDASGAEMANKVFQKAAKDFEKTAEIINNDPYYKGKDVTKGALGRQYQATMNHYFNQQLAQASIDLTTNDQGRAYIYEFDSRSGLMRGREYQAVVQSAMPSGFSLPDYKVELGELGHMISFSVVGELKHYGVKGMRWGVTTKDRAAQTTPGEVQIKQTKPGKYAKTTGGKGLPLSEDAAAALELRQKAKASTTDALSNKELQAAVTRMNLEQQYNNLAFQSDRRSKGARFVAGLFGQKRYGKKRVYTDSTEEAGEEIRKAVKAALEETRKTTS